MKFFTRPEGDTWSDAIFPWLDVADHQPQYDPAMLIARALVVAECAASLVEEHHSPAAAGMFGFNLRNVVAGMARAKDSEGIYSLLQMLEAMNERSNKEWWPLQDAIEEPAEAEVQP